jgi:hypothetical protein
MQQPNIINIGHFIKQEIIKKNNVILDNLKKEINISIDFFVENNNLNDYDDLALLIAKIKSEGYEHMMKIKSYLCLLEIKDKNQTNKYEYERCTNLQLLSNLTYFSTYFEDLKKSVVDIEIDKNLSLLKTKKEDICTSTMQNAVDFFQTKVELKKNENIGEFTIFINQIILCLFTIKEILKDVSISDNNGW